MTTSTSPNWPYRAAAAFTFTLAMTGCDPHDDAVAGDAQDPIDFRNGDGTWGPGKLNTNFLGEDEAYPLNAIPLVDDPSASVRLHAVWSTRCVNRTSGKTFTNGLFYTSGINGVLGIAVNAGELEPATFKQYGKPTVTCTVASNDWIGTVWGVILKDAQGAETHHYLMPLERKLDPHGNPVYRWGVFTGLNLADLFNPTQYKATCAEDLDPFGDAHLLREHAYLVADLDVDPASGNFSELPDQLYLACRSGAVGKAIDWGYAPWQWGNDAHELATRVVRADYCGSGKSFTKKGNALQVRDQLGVNDFAAPALTDEAAWDLDTSRATCVTLPRDVLLQQDFTAITCGDEVLPACSPAAMTGSFFATKLAD